MASISFLLHCYPQKNPFVESHPPIPSLIDICDYLTGQKYPVSRLSFYPKTYPPPLSLDKSTGWSSLSRDLSKAAHTAGNSIILNGSQKFNKDMNHNHVFRCASFHRSIRTTAMELTDEYQCRNTSSLNNRRNNRKQGQHFPKHIKMVDRRGGCTCKFQFMVKWDLHGFYIDLQQKAGNHYPYHTSHPKVLDPSSIPLLTHLLTSDKIEDALNFVKSTSNNVSALNYLHGKFNKFVNIIKIAYLHRRENGHLLSTKDDIDYMMENFELSEEISFVSLSDIPVKEFFNSAESRSPKSTINQDNSHQTPTTSLTVTVPTVKDFSGKVQYTEIK